MGKRLEPRLEDAGSATTAAGAGIRAKAGYSLLEILIVLTIIALIAALVGPRLFAQLDRSKTTTARVQARGLETALDTMRVDINRYPTQEEGLALLMQADPKTVTGWAGPYLGGALPDDPWGRPYVYEAPKAEGQQPAVVSLRRRRQARRLGQFRRCAQRRRRLTLAGGAGFSVLEMLIVLVVIALAVAIVMPRGAAMLDQATAHSVFFDFQRQVSDLRLKAYRSEAPLVVAEREAGVTGAAVASPAAAAGATGSTGRW